MAHQHFHTLNTGVLMLENVLPDDSRVSELTAVLSSAVQSNNKGFMVVSFTEMRKIMHECVRFSASKRKTNYFLTQMLLSLLMIHLH